jgi:hypothetical protein
MAMWVTALVGCVVTTAPPPKIEGRVNAVSRQDIQDAIAVVERDMRHEYWIVYAITKVEVRGRNSICITYDRGDYYRTTCVDRVDGRWSLPAERVRVL